LRPVLAGLKSRGMLMADGAAVKAVGAQCAVRNARASLAALRNNCFTIASACFVLFFARGRRPWSSAADADAV
jgi:hypothetical protein